MLRRITRLLPLLLLILLVGVVPTGAQAGSDLSVTITHAGNSGANFVRSSTTGTVSVAVANIGDTDTAGAITVSVALDGGLTLGATVTSQPGGFFTCSNAPTPVTCTSANVIPDGATETITFTVNAPSAAATGPFTNSATVSGGGDVNPTNNSDDDDVDFAIVANVDIVITDISHTGNAFDNHFYVNTNTGTVTVAVENRGTDASSGNISLQVNLGDALTFYALTSSALFSCVGGYTVTCTTGAVIDPLEGDTITFRVTAAPNLDYDNLITAAISGGGDVTLHTAQDSSLYSVVSSGSVPVPGTTATFPPVPTAIPATAVPSATLIPPIPSRTPPPRPANAGIAVGPIPRPGVTVVVDRDGVNVRLLPAIGAEVIATVNAGYTTDIIARSPDSEWVQVEIGGQLGWIGTAVLAIIGGDLNAAPVSDPRTIPWGGFENPRAGLTSATSPFTGKLQLSGLRVRSGPGRAYPMLANAPRYTIFPLLGRTLNNTWVQVNFEGTLGWVAAQFVEFQQGLGTLDQLPIDGIVADGLPISEPTGDNYTDTLRFMLARVELAQPSLDEIRGIWTNIALGGRAQCGGYPARPTNINIPNPILAPFYGTLFPLQTDFNSAMTNLREAIDLLIDACRRPQPPEGLVGQPVVQAALDYINAADAQFVSLRERLHALLPPDRPITDDECLFTFNNRSEIVPRLRINEGQIVTLTATHFVRGFCFDAGVGQSLRIQALQVSGNARPRLTVSAFNNATNFLGVGQIEAGGTTANISPILITQTGQYILIVADLDGGDGGLPLEGDIAVLLTDITGTSGVGGITLALDPVTGDVIVTQGGIAPATPAPGVTPGISTPVVTCPGVNYTCEQLTCEQAYACLPFNTNLDGDRDGIPCENVCGGG